MTFIRSLNKLLLRKRYSLFLRLVFALTLLVFGPTSDMAAQEPNKEGEWSGYTPIPNEYIIAFKESSFTNNVNSQGLTASQLANNLAQQHNSQINYIYEDAIKGFSATIPLEDFDALIAHPDVDYFVPNGTETIEPLAGEEVSGANDALSWGLDRIDQRNLPLDGNYYYPASGENVNVYIVDGGISATQPDFEGRFGSGVSIYPNSASPYPDCGFEYGAHHGTHVAGTIGGAVFDVAKRVTLHSVRIHDCFLSPVGYRCKDSYCQLDYHKSPRSCCSEYKSRIFSNK